LTALVQHLLGLLALAGIVVGPLPLCLGLVPLESRSPARALLAVLVTWCLLQVCVGLVLGVTGWLWLGGVLLCEAVAFFAGLAMPAGRRGLAVLRASRPHLVWPEHLLVFAFAVLGLTLLIRLATAPITDHDSLAYHLPAMARWHQTHALVTPEPIDASRFALQIGRYPFAWELLCTLFLMPFHEDFLVALPNLIAWLIFGLATYLVAVELGARRIHALTAAFLLLAMPMARKHVDTMHVDLPLAAFFMASLYFAFACETTRSRATGALCLAAAGMVAGIKMSGLLYAALPLATLIVVRTKAARAVPAFGGTATALAAAGLLAGGFWYAKNLIELGNPLGFVRGAVGGVTLLPGSIDPVQLRETSLASVLDVTSLRHWRILASAAWEQLRLPFVLIVVSALALIVRPARAGEPPRPSHLSILLGLAVLTAAAYCTTPFGGVLTPYAELSPWTGQAFRYAFPFLGVLAILSALGASRLPARGAGVVALLGVSGVVAAMTSTAMACSAAIMLVGLAVAAAVRRAPGRMASVVACGMLCVGLAAGTFWMRARRDVERARAYGGASEYIATHLVAGETVGYLFAPRTYLLYGKDIANPVVYVPTRAGDLEGWIDDLRQRRVALLAVGPLREGWRNRTQLAWLSAPDGHFVRVFGEDPRSGPVVYRLR